MISSSEASAQHIKTMKKQLTEWKKTVGHLSNTKSVISIKNTAAPQNTQQLP